MKKVVKTKLGLRDDVSVKLVQLRMGKTIDLEDGQLF